MPPPSPVLELPLTVLLFKNVVELFPPVSIPPPVLLLTVLLFKIRLQQPLMPNPVLPLTVLLFKVMVPPAPVIPKPLLLLTVLLSRVILTAPMPPLVLPLTALLFKNTNTVGPVILPLMPHPVLLLTVELFRVSVPSLFIPLPPIPPHSTQLFWMINRSMLTINVLLMLIPRRRPSSINRGRAGLSRKGCIPPTGKGDILVNQRHFSA